MSVHSHHLVSRFRRRGVVALQVGVMMVVLLGCAALTIDVGQLYSARTDLQKAADSAAMAGVSAFISDDMMRVRQGIGGAGMLDAVKGTVDSRAGEFAYMNETLGAGTEIEAGDVRAGWINLNSATEPLNTSPAPADYNAVYVMVRRTGGVNGSVPLFFSGIFGRYVAHSSASAIAAFDDRFKAFDSSVPNNGMLPFTICEDAFKSEVANGDDNYSWNETGGVSNNSGDNINEVRLYPYPLSGTEESPCDSTGGGDGNFGVLNIGTGNEGVEAERVQILNGVSAEDFLTEIGTSELTFIDEGGYDTTYTMTGSPGLEVTLESTVEQLIGQVVGFFLHDGVVKDGSLTEYTITGIRFGRVMDVRLTGPPNQRGLFIQPVSYAGGGIIIDPEAPSSNGFLGRIVLVR